MKYLYTMLPELNYNTEEFIEKAKGSIRLKLNTILSHNLPVFNSFYNTIFIEDYLSKFEYLKFISEQDSLPDNYIFLFNTEELEEIFRQEIEYHIIKRKLPVWLSAEKNQCLKVYLADSKLEIKREQVPLLKFKNFKEAEKLIFKTFSTVERVSVAKSIFAEELNLLVLYKINETLVKQDLEKN